MSITIRAGGQVTKDPDASEVYVVDWDSEHLTAGVTITTSAWTITKLRGATSSMTKDSESILAGSRTTQLRLIGGTLGQIYRVTNRIVTNENPTRTKDASFKVLIEEQ
jgi:hypothetical protein